MVHSENMQQRYKQRIKQKKIIIKYKLIYIYIYIYIISVYKFCKSNYYRNQSKFSLQEKKISFQTLLILTVRLFLVSLGPSDVLCLFLVTVVYIQKDP